MITTGIIAGVLSGELESRYEGVCELKRTDDRLVVTGENDHAIYSKEIAELPRTETTITEQQVFGVDEKVDLFRVKFDIVRAIDAEHDEL